jgi:hypothetical protein
MQASGRRRRSTGRPWRRCSWTISSASRGWGEAVPDGFGIDDEDGTVFALVEAAGLIDADAVLEAGGFDGVLEGATEFLAVFVAAAGAGGGFVALVEADKEVVFKDWHWKDWMQDGGLGCGTAMT